MVAVQAANEAAHLAAEAAAQAQAAMNSAETGQSEKYAERAKEGEERGGLIRLLANLPVYQFNSSHPSKTRDIVIAIVVCVVVVPNTLFG